MTTEQRARLDEVRDVLMAVGRGDLLDPFDALAAERDRETQLRREAERHNAELRAALDAKPYIDEYEDAIKAKEQAERTAVALRVLLHEVGHQEGCPLYYDDAVAQACECGLSDRILAALAPTKEEA